jgi:RNA polymerase sigma-70 factor (ECF subfamily)
VAAPTGDSLAADRRRVRSADGRRVAERRALLVEASPPGALPAALAPSAARVGFVERIAPTPRQREDAEAARLVGGIQAGEEGFEALYGRYFDAVLAYARVVLRDEHGGLDVAQQTFARALEALPRYEWRGQPVRAWLFTIARNALIDHRAKLNRIRPEDPAVLARRREHAAPEPPRLGSLGDGELQRTVGRLPLPQRQVIVLRYMNDLSYPEIADLLGRSPDAVRQIHQRALARLRARLGGELAPRPVGRAVPAVAEVEAPAGPALVTRSLESDRGTRTASI